eukprot:PITA_30567
MNSICLVLSLATSFKWEVHQMDVKFAFLHGGLHEEIYMEQPPGFIQTNFSYVCQLKKSLYGPKKAPQAWYAKMDSFLLDIGFCRCHSDNTVYTKKVEASPLLVGFIDSDWASEPDDRKSTVGYVFTLGFGPITWACKKKSSISLYLVEAKYRGAVEASKEALWLRHILSEFSFHYQHPTTLWCDNQSAIQLCKDPVQNQSNKHIELHMHFIKKFNHDHLLEVQYWSTNDQVANIFTKALTKVKFTKL